MTTRTLVIAALLIAGFEPGAQPSAQGLAPAGVLVGIYKPGDHEFVSKPPAPAAVRTVWLDSNGSNTPTLPRLLVPRSSGFWWLGVTGTCSEEPREDLDGIVIGVEAEINETLWSSPAGVRPIPDAQAAAWKCGSAEVSCYTHFGVDIDWVWPDFISISSVGESGCGAHPDSSYRPEVHRLDDLETALTVRAVLGADAETRVRRAYEREKLEYRSRHRDGGCDDPHPFSPTAWHVTRQRGRWLLEGWADTHRLCEVGIDYSAEVDFSRITGSTVREWPLPGVSGVKDAIASADGKWILLIRQDEVMLSPREAPDKPLARASLSARDIVVMAEWAHGRNVVRWRDQVRTLASTGFPRPRD